MPIGFTYSNFNASGQGVLFYAWEGTQKECIIPFPAHLNTGCFISFISFSPGSIICWSSKWKLYLCEHFPHCIFSTFKRQIFANHCHHIDCRFCVCFGLLLFFLIIIIIGALNVLRNWCYKHLTFHSIAKDWKNANSHLLFYCVFMYTKVNVNRIYQALLRYLSAIY